MININSNIHRLYSKHFTYAIKYYYLLPKVARNYFKLIVFKKKVLRGVEFALTYKCNSSCSHCSCSTLIREDKSLMSAYTIKRVVDQCIKLGALQFNLTGGEALYRSDILDLAEYIGSKDVVLSIATNGILLNKNMAKALSDRRVRIITLSIDSINAEEHDRRHNFAGSFDKMIEAVHNSKWAGMDVFLCTICTPENMRNNDMWRMIRLAEELNVTITLNIACPVGGWNGNSDIFLEKEAMEEYRKMLMLPHVRWEGLSNYIKEGCPAGVEKIYISPYGDVMPCPRVHISYGNVMDASLEDIWGRIVSPSSPFHASNYDYEVCPAGNNREYIERYIPPFKTQNS